MESTPATHCLQLALTVPCILLLLAVRENKQGKWYRDLETRKNRQGQGNLWSDIEQYTQDPTAAIKCLGVGTG